MGGREESAVRHPQRLPPGSCRLPSSAFTKPPSLPSARSCLLPGPLIVLVLPRKAELLFFPWRAGTVFARGGCRGPSGMSAPRRAGRSGTGGGVPRSPECAGSAGEGRRRARQCHGLIFIPISLCCVAPLPPLPGRDAQGEGPRGAVGRSGVAHKLLRRDRESTRVGPKSVGGGSQDPVTRCLGVCEKGWSDICSKIASFLSTFSFSTRKHLKTTCITNGLWGGGGGVKESGLEMALFLRQRGGPPWWEPIWPGEVGVPAIRGRVDGGVLG